MLIEGNHLIAESNKSLKCIWDNKLYGKEVWLGKVYYKDNIKLDTPYELSVEDFEEVDSFVDCTDVTKDILEEIATPEEVDSFVDCTDVTKDILEEINNSEEDYNYDYNYDFEEIDNMAYQFQGMSYDEIKIFVIKLHYSNDDIISIMLNDDEEKIKEMHEWCEYASIIACKYTNDMPEKIVTIPSTVTKVLNIYGFPPDCAIHFLSPTPPTICSFIPTRVKFYVGDGSSAAHDDAILADYVSVSEWSSYASRLDTWYNYIHPS